jgi:hypothetical protein
LTSSATGVDESRAADADGRRVADDAEDDLVLGDAHGLDRAVGGAHAAADLRGLEGGPGGRRVVSSRSALPSAISQFVPTSMNRRRRLSRVMPEASSPETMSPPT